MLRFTLDEKGIHKYQNNQRVESMASLYYTDEKGYGWLNEAGTFPKRKQAVERIEKREDGFWIKENDESISWTNENHYNYGGMTFRVKLEPGTYHIKVIISSKPEETNVSMGGMIAQQLLSGGYWDAPRKVKRTKSASWEGKTWTYDYVLGKQFLEIEIEPRWDTHQRPVGVLAEVGVKEIIIEPVALAIEGEKPTIHLLGDSTVKSYVYEEAPMNGWGQIIGDYLDLERVKVLNYSQGGRSLKTMYQEGRLNDALLHGKPGDYIIIQSGHNDESREALKGIEARFGRGNTERTFAWWLETYFIPAIKARKMYAIFVTCMTRIDSEYYSRQDIEDFDKESVHFAGFKYGKKQGIDFPGIMKQIGDKYKIPVINLYEMSIQYVHKIGGEAARSMFLSLEAGETPGKTNSGSYANGNPSQSCDGTHYKECLGKQFVRMILTDLVKQKIELMQYIKEDYKALFSLGDDAVIEKGLFPEIAPDVVSGKNAYYRNQIEKLVKLGVLKLRENGLFEPKAAMTTYEYQTALEQLWQISLGQSVKKSESYLTVEKMGHLIYRAYSLKFGKDEFGRWIKPRYMTDYNGVNLSPDDPNYDSNLVGESAQYYPLVPWEQLKDLEEIDAFREELKAVYELGLLRSEKGIIRGKMVNGDKIEPRRIVTREKAAKSLYFLWVLIKGIKEES